MTRSATRSSAERSVTSQFSSLCAEFDGSPLQGATLRHARLIVLDTLGAMLSASRPSFRGTQSLARFVSREGGDGRCGVVGTSIRTAPTQAALMNGYLGYALDVESQHGAAVVHAAAAVLPAALAAGELTDATGLELLSALVLGIDVACRVSLAVGPNDLYERGFHPTAIAGSFGAAAAAGHLLQLDSDAFERAFGLAATETGGLLAWASDHTEESRPFNPGLAARNGVTAALLAQGGFGAPRGIFDFASKYNVFRAWSLDAHGRPDELTAEFGERFAISELTIKRYACCAFLHPALDGLTAILREDGVRSDRITGISMCYPRSGAPIIDNNELRSHRAQYILPIGSVRGEVLFEDVIEDRSDEPEVRRLSGITTLIHDEELDRTYPEKYATVIEVTTGDGQCHRRRFDYALGSPQNPMPEDAILEKFRRLAGQRCSSVQVAQIEDAVMRVDETSGVDVLMQSVRVD